MEVQYIQVKEHLLLLVMLALYVITMEQKDFEDVGPTLDVFNNKNQSCKLMGTCVPCGPMKRQNNGWIQFLGLYAPFRFSGSRNGCLSHRNYVSEKLYYCHIKFKHDYSSSNDLGIITGNIRN